MALDKMRFHNIMVREMDAPSEATTELADVVDEGIRRSTSELATHSDLEALRIGLLAEMQSMFNSHLRWIMVMWGSTFAAIVGLAVAIILRGT